MLRDKRKRIASWEVTSSKDEPVVHLIKGWGTLCNQQGYKKSGGRDTLANNLKKRPCPDCMGRMKAAVAAKRMRLDDEQSLLDMFSKLKRGD